MSSTDISKHKDTFMRLLSRGRLYDAIKLLRSIAEENLAWEISDDINQIDSSYSYLLQYAMQGYDDPGRKDIYDSLKANLMTAFNRYERHMKSKSAYSSYFNTLRTLVGKSPAKAIEAYKQTHTSSNDFAKVLSPDSASQSPEAIEAKERDVFNAVWTSFPLKSDSVTAISELLVDDIVPGHVKSMVLSALMLGNLEYQDSIRYVILADSYTRYSESDPKLAMTALSALLICLYVNRSTPLDRKTMARLQALTDEPHWKSDIKAVFLEFIRTRDTERITRKMTDEIVPEMLKIKPEIEKRMTKSQLDQLDMNEMEENPEWQELLDKSGIADKMKELTEIQEEGGDVMMGTFSHLKSFPFFNQVANWFIPFHTDHSVALAAGESAELIASLLDKAPFMCDSDKYSFILALSSVAPAQKNLMASQLKQQNISAAEIQNAQLDLFPDRRRNYVNKFVQNLYRFFRLFNRRQDFHDPFAGEINLAEVKLLSGEFTDDTLPLVAEFYFSHKYFEEALTVYKEVEATSPATASLYQKMGYCEQKLGHMSEAIRYYEQSELLDQSSAWTTKKLAACYKALGQYENALNKYREIEIHEPDSPTIAASIGTCLSELGRHDEAIKAFFKASYLTNDSPKMLRGLGWAQIMGGDFNGASAAYVKLFDRTDRQADDILNAGHAALGNKDFPTALSRYLEYVNTTGGNFTRLINAVRADTPYLEAAGVDPDIIPLMLDAAAYKFAGR